MESRISISIKHLQNLLLLTFGFLQLAYFLTLYAKYALGRGLLWGFTNFFNFDAENCAPAWFESFLFLMAALLLYVIGRIEKNRGGIFRHQWAALSWIFVYFSLDEVASLHEKANKPLRKLLGIQGGYFEYAWVILGMIFLVVLAFYLWKFFWSLAPKLRTQFFIAGSVFVAGALIGELFGADTASRLTNQDMSYIFLAWAEETCEISGMLYFVITLVNWLKQDVGEFSIGFQ